MRKTLSAFLALVLMCGFGAAQGSNGSISGTVTDATRAVVPGVTMTAENTQTGVASTTISNEAGVYNFPSLQPGVYRVSAELPGFKKLVNNDVRVEVGGRLTLNMQLEIGNIEGTVVEVTAQMDAAIALGASSIGGMIAGNKVQDLPLAARNVLDLVETQAGVVGDNFAGARIGALNITRDGINVMEQHINQGVSSVIVTTPDLVQEVRVVTSPADAEFGRGAGQVQILTRSGTNEFHGSLFESHRNTVLNANTWFNNLNRTPRNVLIRNQFGARLGGPIIKNRTFFHFLWDAQREVTKNAVTSTTFTDAARNGIFRFYPGVQNGNANASIPTVDINGNPVRPAAATGPLQEVNLFGRDPNRMTSDRSGAVAAMLRLMPSPNNFREGDGLNTAGYTWSRDGGTNRDQWNIKVDHTFNSRHSMNVSYTREHQDTVNGFLPTAFPGGPSGFSQQRDYFFSANLTSTLTSTIVNEVRAGGQHASFWSPAPWDVPENEESILKLPSGKRYAIDFLTVTEPVNQGNDTQGRLPPIYVLSDNLSWIKGRHSFKGGVEIRSRSSLVTSSFDSMPRAVIGAGGAPVVNINSMAIQGLGQNEAAAQNLLLNLSGSLSEVRQAFNSGAPPNLAFTEQYKNRHWQQREFSFFFKDDFKVSPALTLNLGVRYEWYGVPYEKHGRNAGVKGGSKALFGVTGTDWSDLFQPGVFRGALTDVELVGKNSPNPDKKLYNNDWNNFAPAVGLSWSLPWFGKDKTVLRMGYGVGYEINSLRLLNVVSGDQPGLRTLARDTRNRYLDLTSFTLPITSAIVGAPLETVPSTDRTQTIRAYDSNMRTPYTQNFNVAIQRELPYGLTLDVRYVGNKGTKLIRGVTVNEVNIFENGLLNAFLAVQAGGESELLDRIFRGVNLGNGAINGTTVRAGAGLRNNSNTRGFFANNNVGAFANFINTSNNFTTNRGDLLKNAGLPDNFVVANTQFLHSRVSGNFANSTYHSMQIDVTKRYAGGYTFQNNLTWSKSLGEEEGSSQEQSDNYRNGRNRALDKRLLSFHREFVFRSSGTFELPIGPGKPLFTGSSGLVARLIERWQIGVILNLFSGQPLNFTSDSSTFNAETDGTPDQLGPIPITGAVTRVKDGVVFLSNLQQVNDPRITLITTAQGLQGRSTLKAIADSQGRVIMANPLPGTIGTMGYRTFFGPGEFGFDANLVKRVRIDETKEFEFRIDAIDVLNKPTFGNPNTNINNVNFGRITSAGGNRIVVLNARINF